MQQIRGVIFLTNLELTYRSGQFWGFSQSSQNHLMASLVEILHIAEESCLKSASVLAGKQTKDAPTSDKRTELRVNEKLRKFPVDSNHQLTAGVL